MKRLLFTLISVAVTLGMTAQSFVDSFESYPAGAYLAQSSPLWTTWSGATGGPEDVRVTTADAYSGSQSIYFSSTDPNGGPQDVVLPFSTTALETGQFSFETMIKVESNKAAYLNFQAEPTIGTQWALEIFLTQGGEAILISEGETLISTTYSQNTWTEIAFDINLNTNEWELLIDGVTQGTFTNPINKLASLDIFPVNSEGSNESGFYIDDLSFTHVPYTLPSVNGAVIAVEDNLTLAGQTKAPIITVRNLGLQNITSFNITVDYDGNQYQETVTGVSIPSLGLYELELSQDIAAAAGSNTMTATISDVNGLGADDDPADDSKSVTIDPIVPAPGKIVVAEEATGTWCGWCPRGTVAMAEMESNYADFFAGIAVHNGDPMVNNEYDNGINPYIAGYPSALVNRKPEIDPSEIEQSFLQYIINPPVAVLEHKATFHEGHNELYVDVVVDFKQAISGNWKLAMVLTEDSVRGTASGYGQVNYYSYQANDIPLVGAGLDWQSEPSTVPASKMVYDHVARAIVPSFGGKSNAFPSSVSVGDTFHHHFSVTIDAEWDFENMHIITLLIKPNGEIDNAGKSSASEASKVTAINVSNTAFKLDLYPNPANDYFEIALETKKEQEISLQVININGEVVFEQPATRLSGKNYLPVNTDVLTTGIYLVRVRAGDELVTKKLIIQ